MTSESTKDVLNQIDGVIGEKFKEKGFLSKKQGEFELFNIDGNIYTYEILLTKNKGYFSLSLRLLLKNKELMKNVNNILELVLNDESYAYPAGWDEKAIRESKNIRLANNVVTMLTDWRFFKGEESLENFNRSFSIWMCVFDHINEIIDWEAQLLRSIDYSITWFACARSSEWIANNTQYPALYLLKKHGEADKLKERYIEILSKSRNKKEVELYLKYLCICAELHQ